jgi:hypothetical protein
MLFEQTAIETRGFSVVGLRDEIRDRHAFHHPQEGCKRGIDNETYERSRCVGEIPPGPLREVGLRDPENLIQSQVPGIGRKPDPAAAAP